MKKLKKILGGLKNKGMRNAPWDELGEKGDFESRKKAPHDQMKGGKAKKIEKWDKKQK